MEPGTLQYLRTKTGYIKTDSTCTHSLINIPCVTSLLFLVRSRKELDNVACQHSIELLDIILQGNRLALCMLCNNTVPYISRFQGGAVRYETEVPTFQNLLPAECNQTVRDFLERAEMRNNGLIIKTGNGLALWFQPFCTRWR